jgi:hypothetical protein
MYIVISFDKPFKTRFLTLSTAPPMIWWLTSSPKHCPVGRLRALPVCLDCAALEGKWWNLTLIHFWDEWHKTFHYLTDFVKLSIKSCCIWNKWQCTSGHCWNDQCDVIHDVIYSILLYSLSHLPMGFQLSCRYKMYCDCSNVSLPHCSQTFHTCFQFHLQPYLSSVRTWACH